MNEKNATHLFQHDKLGIMKNSESRWTAVAQLALVYLSSIKKGTELPVYESDEKGYLTPKKDALLIAGFTNRNTVCECTLSARMFNTSNFGQFAYLKPDILRVDASDEKVVLIEVKAFESVKRTISLYDELRRHLNSAWTCKLYYLLSHGHEKHKDWPLLQKQGSSIIIWEDLLRAIVGTPIGDLIDDNLIKYCTKPESRP